MKIVTLIALILLSACSNHPKVDWKVGSCYQYRTADPFQQNNSHPRQLIEIRGDYGALVICNIPEGAGCSNHRYTISGKGWDETLKLSLWATDYDEVPCPKATK